MSTLKRFALSTFAALVVSALPPRAANVGAPVKKFHDKRPPASSTQ